ncbi:uncharacterized protein LOC124116008 [Haliotis rufescens]|uniref:uncharacterized protein LOC124116008 n=1 Tax=Haliotis rufescens TaxID=6454 RepID=UPI00201F0F35|nr:uncharacterized protein LOC124116008 [Haliotis rufescens]
METLNLLQAMAFVSFGLWRTSSGERTISTDGDWAVDFSSTSDIDVAGTEWQYFSVQCCNDAFVVLFSLDKSKQAEAGLGIIGNAKSFMRLCQGCPEYGSPCYPYLSCTEYRHFWISWIGGTLEVGQGHYVGEQVMLSSGTYTAWLNFKPIFIGFKSGHGSSGKWMIDDNPPHSGYFFEMASEKNKIMTRPLFRSLTSRSKTDCVAMCQRLRMCKSLTYRGSDKTCHQHTDIPRAHDFVGEDGWVTLVLDETSP